MASIVKRKNKFSVVYTYLDDMGVKKQRWESFSTKEEAKRRKDAIEYEQDKGTFIIPSSRTLAELLEEYMSIYGVSKWSMSTYDSRKSLIAHYINPIIGEMKLEDITPRTMDRYYQELLKVRSVTHKYANAKTEFLTPRTVREIHKILRNAFNQAVKWELMGRNPVENATLPKHTPAKRDIWTSDTLFSAIEACEDDDLQLAMNLAFSCSLRMGELLALTWDCVDISEESINNGTASIYVNKELQRVQRDTYEMLSGKGVVLKFPSLVGSNSTVLVLKEPKTKTSVRRIYLPGTVAQMLVERKAEQEKLKELFGEEYTDYGLVFAFHNGRPIEAQNITREFNNLIKKNNLPKVVFHSLRHSSITYKLKLNGGDMKSVQGDSGHAQLKMVADVYSHIIDEDRCLNAQRFEEEFYSRMEMPRVEGKIPPEMKEEMKPLVKEDAQAGGANSADGEKDSDAAPDTDDRALVEKLLANPEALALLKSLAKTL